MVELTDAEVLGNTPQPPAVANTGLSDAEVLGGLPTTTPLASVSASPQQQGLSDADVLGTTPTSPQSTHWAPTRGLVSGFAQDYPNLAGETLEGLSHFAPEHFKQPLREGADYLRSVGATAPAGYERTAPKLQDIKGLGDAATWAGETFGQGVSSTAAPIALGLAGGATMGIPGAIAGGVAGSAFQNYGEVYKALKDAGVEPERAAKVSAVVLPIMSALDVGGLFPAGKALGIGAAKSTLIKKLAEGIAAKKGAETLGKTVAESAIFEGGTEGLQELTKQGAITHETGAPLFTASNAWDILENTLGGALVGAPFGAGAHLAGGGAKSVDNQRAPTTEEVQQAFANYKQGQEFSDPQLEVLRRMTGRADQLGPEGGNFQPSVQSAMLPTNVTPSEADVMGPGPLWYSKAEDIAQKLPETATAQDMRGRMLNLGARHEELTWTGLDEFFHSKGANVNATPETLDQTVGGPSAVLALENWKAENWGNLMAGQKKPSPPAELLSAANAERADLRKRQGEAARAQTGAPTITKQDVLNHLRENRYTLKETIRDDITAPITQTERNMQEEQTRLGERLDQLDQILDNENHPINIGGGEQGVGGRRIAVLEEWNQVYGRLNEVSRILNDANVKRPTPEYSSFVTPGERRGYATLSIQVPENERAGDMMSETPNRYGEDEIRKARGYRQPHFTGDQYRNTVAFVTLTLREDSSGQMTAHMEQIQSDWHQLARTQGYISKALLDQEIAALRAQDEAHDAFVQYLGNVTNNPKLAQQYESRLRDAIDSKHQKSYDYLIGELETAFTGRPEAANLARKYATAYQARLKITDKINKAVADAPYKMTQDWTRLMLRRVLRWAADRGIQRVTWNNPELAWQYPTGSAGAATQDPSKMDMDTKRRWEGIKKHYGQTIPSVAKELARQYGGEIGVTQIKTSSVGPWVARPFVANGVVTGWGMGRWEGAEDVFGPTQSFNNFTQYSGGATRPTFSTQADAQQTIEILKSAGYLRDTQVGKFSNQVMYLDFDRRAQWNFQAKGFPSFMLNTMPAHQQLKNNRFEIYEDSGISGSPVKTPVQAAAYKFGEALAAISQKIGFKGGVDLVLYSNNKIPYAANPALSPMGMHTYTFDTHKHTIEIDLSQFDRLAVSDALKVSQVWSTMMHELGHAIMWEHYDALPASTKLAIQGGFDKFLTDTQGMQKLGDRVARRASAIGTMTAHAEWAAKDWNALPQVERDYWAAFDEWFADQVARWGTTSDRPLSIVERAVKGISDMLKAVFTAMTSRLGINLRAEKVMEDWLNSFLTTEAGFGQQQYLNLQAQQVKEDQRAVSGEEPDMTIPIRSPQADTIKQSAQAATYGASPPGIASSAVHASRFNRFYKYMAGLAQLAEANPAFAPLIRYVERMRRMHLDESNIHDAAIRIRKDWRNLQGQAENLTAFINDLVNMEFLTPAEKARGVIRQPNAIEQNNLVTKHQLSAAGLKVFQKIKILNDWVLDLTAQSAKKSVTRALNANPVLLVQKIDEINQKVLDLKKKPFFPFMRFGRNFVIQKDTAGNTVHFETFERFGLKSAERQQQQRVEELRNQFPGYPEPEVGVLPEAASPFVGLPPMLLEEIRNKLTLTPTQNDALDNLMYQHSTATKFPRAFKQSYTKGYSMDFQRSFARYFFYAGKYYARAEHSAELNDDIRAARLVGGNTATQIANFMADHLKNTVLEAKGDFGIFKGGIFLWAMGYVPAAATQNLTQTPMITFPYLAGKFGDIKATRAMANAMRQMSSFYRRGAYEKTGNLEMEAIDYGIKHGIVTESQASELAAASQGMNLLKGIGGNTVQRNWQAFMEKSAWMFEMAEQWNRRIAYRAGYNLALENPNAAIVQEAVNTYRGEYNSLSAKSGNRQWAAAVITASYVTTKTQYEYARWARPRFMRGRLPGTLFVFKTYMANTLWMLANNKSDVLPRYLMIAGLMGGLAGIPGYEDLAGILKAIGHWLNKDFNVEHELRRFVNSHFDGKIPPDMIIGGLARRGYGIPALLDMLGSFATGVPGRGFDGKVAGQNVPFPVLDRHRAITLGPLLPIEPGKLFDPTDDINRTIAEQSQKASGAVFSVGFNIYKAIMDNKLEATDWKRWERAIPRELGDITRTWRAFSEGRERSKGGPNSAPTIADFNWRDSEQAAEMLAMLTGYQPLRVQAKWDSIMAKAEVEKFYEMQQKTLFGQLFEARKGGNPAEIESVLESIRRYNRELPAIARGYVITQENAKASITGRERELIARERGVPTQKRNVPISRFVDTLFPETTVDVRRVR